MVDRFLTTGSVDAVIGRDYRITLFKDESDTDFNETSFNEAVAMASSIVRSAAENAGYSISGTGSIPYPVQMATLEIFLPIAYGRKSQVVPNEIMSRFEGLTNDIRTGRIPIPGLEPSSKGGVGAAIFSDSSTTTTDGKPAIFKNLRKFYGA